MAQKRMFDKKIVSSDKFIDLPHSSKALYFMAGMEADDKGFFQPRKIQKMCGFNDDDFKILIAKGYFIPFESGVMVVTDWNKNNWLDSRRITETEYIDELNLLKLVNNKYELSQPDNCFAKPMLSEYSIEENSIEENSIYNQAPSSKLDDVFEKLWLKYPKKQGKKNAKKHFINAVKKGIAVELIEKGLDSYLNYINKNHISMKYIKQGSSWFNQESWNDDYDIDIVEQKEKSKVEQNKELLERLRNNG